MRDISTLSPQEGGGLWDAVMPFVFKPFRGNSYHYNASDTCPERVIFMSGVERLCVQFDGKVWADSDLQPLTLDQEKIRAYLSGIGISLPLSFEQVEILGHSLGVNVLHAKNSTKKKDKKLPKEFYRNRFCAGEDHDDFPTLQSLEKMGYMAQFAKINSGRDTLWYVTDEGIKIFRERFDFHVCA